MWRRSIRLPHGLLTLRPLHHQWWNHCSELRLQSSCPHATSLPWYSLIEPSSDLVTESRANTNTTTAREVLDGSAAHSQETSQPNRPEGEVLPVGIDTDPPSGLVTARVNQSWCPITSAMQSLDTMNRLLRRRLLSVPLYGGSVVVTGVTRTAGAP